MVSSDRVYPLERLRRVRAGHYETLDRRYRILRGADAWGVEDARRGAWLVESNTKLGCEVILARFRAFHAATITWHECQQESEPYVRAWGVPC